jgi:hypothetical protein
VIVVDATQQDSAFSRRLHDIGRAAGCQHHDGVEVRLMFDCEPRVFQALGDRDGAAVHTMCDRL